MCGISGIISKTMKNVDPTLVIKMNNLVAHRGPDDDGVFVHESVGLGHRRLSIIDLSKDGHQPMTYRKRYTMTFNGEIYNYIEIREELISAGYSFVSKSDSEVILAAYDQWGDQCVSRFNGMWAIAIFDLEKNTVFCSRDRFGVKPVYYVESADYFVFGSEIKQLLPFIRKPSVNMEVMLDYLVSGYEDRTEDTFFKMIKKLPGGFNLTYDVAKGSYTIRQFYELQINESVSRLSEEESIELFKKYFYSAVQIRLRSDVTVGTCLSGGLDSSSIAAISAGMLRSGQVKSYNGIHAKNANGEFDESNFAEMVASSSGIMLNTTVPTYDDFTANVDKVIALQEEPFDSPSIVLQYFVFKKAAELGCKVMLDGQGGDETLLGYERYLVSYFYSLIREMNPAEIVRALSNMGVSVFTMVKFLAYFGSSNLRINYLKQKHSYLKRSAYQYYNTEPLRKYSTIIGDFRALQLLEITQTQLPHLLRYEDKNSMAHAVESRLPFLDYRLVETSLSINPRYKINKGWSKFVLRKAMNGILPSEIIWRKNKFGFNHSSEWVGKYSDTMFAVVQNSELLRSISDMTVIRRRWQGFEQGMKWKLYNLAQWEKTFEPVVE